MTGLAIRVPTLVPMKELKNKYWQGLLIAAFLPVLLLFASPGAATDKKTFRIVFYNLENLFDTYNDTLTRDEEFLPGGEKHWTEERYRKKIINILKVVAAGGEDNMPSLIGVSEVENSTVLEDLLYDTPLKKVDYTYVHYNSRDARGIDVALIYLPDMFMPMTSSVIGVELPGDWDSTRDILYVKGMVRGVDAPLHVFVNHWPSRRGGQAASEEKRMAASQALRKAVNALLLNEPGAMYVVMGDFNDRPTNRSLEGWTGGMSTDGKAGGYSTEGKSGSYKYRGGWYMFDNIITSASLLHSESDSQIQVDAQLKVIPGSYRVFSPSFLLTEDKTYLGMKPFATYSGYKYSGGFSDHLPVMLDLRISK